MAQYNYLYPMETGNFTKQKKKINIYYIIISYVRIYTTQFRKKIINEVSTVDSRYTAGGWP